MDSKVIHGQEFFMGYNQPKGDDKGKGKGKGKGKDGGDPGEKPDGCKSIMVRNLKASVDEDALWEIFEKASKVKVVTDRETGEPRGFAFVDFDEDDDVVEAIKKNNTEVHGQAISLKYNVPREKGEKGEKGDGKGKGKGKGKGGDASAAKAKTSGSIQEFSGSKV